MKQYPHTITLSSVAQSTQDGSGNYVQGSGSTFDLKGRFETNKGNLFLTTADGKQIVYSGIIYGSLSTPNIVQGTSLVVKNGADTIANGNVLQFSRGQLNVRIWI